MQLSRRVLLSALGTSVVIPSLDRHSWAGGYAPKLMMACLGDANGSYSVKALTAQGDTIFEHPLPSRGHAAAFNPNGTEVVVFARRPGTFALVFDLASGALIREINSEADRHFYGHGIFSLDGAELLTTENAISSGEGRIGVRDPENSYRLIGEFPAGGIGPHDLALLPGGRILVVAVGGIHTNPATGRAKLNLETMRPALVYIDLEQGHVIDRFELAPEYFQLSIRHLDVTANGEVAIAMQYEGPDADLVPLIALHDGRDRPAMLAAPEDVTRSMAQYTASVAFDNAGELLAVTHPRGNLVTFWDRAERRLVRTMRTVDGAGIAALNDPGAFLLTGGMGQIIMAKGWTGDLVHLGQAISDAGNRLAFDNHLSSSM